MERLEPARIYFDKDASNDYGPALVALGVDAALNEELGNKGRTEPWQMAFAAGEPRILVTCNARDFEMLHEAGTSWTCEWGILAQARHAGILIIPQVKGSRIGAVVQAKGDLIESEPSLADRLFRWRPTSGWIEL